MRVRERDSREKEGRMDDEVTEREWVHKGRGVDVMKKGGIMIGRKKNEHGGNTKVLSIKAGREGRATGGEGEGKA